MLKAEANRAKIVQDLNRRIFEKFSERYEEWGMVIQCLKVLDVLCSLAEYARTYPENMCLPEILPPIDRVSNNYQRLIVAIVSKLFKYKILQNYLL